MAQEVNPANLVAAGSMNNLNATGWEGGTVTITADFAQDPHGDTIADRAAVAVGGGFWRYVITGLSTSTDYVFSFYALDISGTSTPSYAVESNPSFASYVAQTDYSAQLSTIDWAQIVVPFTTNATETAAYLAVSKNTAHDIALVGVQCEQRGDSQAFDLYPTGQTARPTADASVGAWITDTGASTNLFEAINETSPSDADYVRSPTDPVNAPYVVDLGTLTVPAVNTGHVVRYRYLKSGSATIDLTVELREGYTNEGALGSSTLIKQWVHSGITTTATTATQTLSAGEADAISDYTDLSLRFVANKPA